MSEWTTTTGIWKGFYWRFIAITVASLAVVQVLGFYFGHFFLTQTLPFSVLVTIYMVVPRAKERRLANALVGGAAAFVIGIVLQLAFQYHWTEELQAQQWPLFWEQNLFTLVMGTSLAVLYLRVTEWSERRRAKWDAKRAIERPAADSAAAVRRRNTGKKKTKRR